MARQVRRRWLRLRSLVLLGVLGLMGLAFTGCPPVVVMYGPPAPEYGVPVAKEAPPADGQQTGANAKTETEAAAE